tara:strand:+ start:462 stop:722 length:261 start_codon:yes stop_codon:yes gene_type:complete
MASFVKWQMRLIEAVKSGDQKTIDYCEKIFPKDIEGKPGSLYRETVAKAKQELENKKPKNTPKTGRKSANTKTRSRKKNDDSKQNN